MKRFLFVSMVSAFTWTHAAETDCELAAQYYRLANVAVEEFRQEDALTFMERAAQACPRYQYWQEWGELAAEFGDPESNAKAADAFVKASDLAATGKERARSIARYAQLLFLNEDPQNAWDYIVAARNLDRETQWIADLATDIQARLADLRPSDIKRGLSDMAFTPLKLNRTATASASSGGAGNQTPATERRSIKIPLTFVVNSTRLDAKTSSNIQVLANALVDEEYEEQRFLLVGHADVRGDAASNLALSERRAEAVAQTVIALQPSLAGRIDSSGRGETQPLLLGDSEADHAANRRLEVALLPAER